MLYSIAIRLRIQSYELENPVVLDHILSNLIDHQFIVKHAKGILCCMLANPSPPLPSPFCLLVSPGVFLSLHEPSFSLLVLALFYPLSPLRPLSLSSCPCLDYNDYLCISPCPIPPLSIPHPSMYPSRHTATIKLVIFILFASFSKL